MADIQSLQKLERRVRARIDRLAALNERLEADPTQYLLKLIDLAASGLEVVERLLIDCGREMDRQIEANVWLERRWSEITEELLPTSTRAETPHGSGTKASQVDPHMINLPDFDIDAYTLRFVPRDLAVEHRIIPVQYLGSTLVLAMQDPSDNAAVESVKFFTGLQIEVVVASPEQIQEALTRYYPKSDSIDRWMEDYAEQVSDQLDVPSIDLDALELDPHVVGCVPREVAVKYRVIAFELLCGHAGVLKLAMADPENLSAYDDVKLTTGFDLEIYIASEEAIARAIAKYYADPPPPAAASSAA